MDAADERCGRYPHRRCRACRLVCARLRDRGVPPHPQKRLPRRRPSTAKCRASRSLPRHRHGRRLAHALPRMPRPAHCLRTAMPAERYQLKGLRIGALPILNGFIARMRLEEELTLALRNAGYADAILALMKNILVDRNALYAIEEWVGLFDVGLVARGKI